MVYWCKEHFQIFYNTLMESKVKRVDSVNPFITKTWAETVEMLLKVLKKTTVLFSISN